MSSFWNLVKRFLAFPLWAAVATLIAIVCGLLASGYTETIKLTIGTYVDGGNFWHLTILAAALLFLQQWSSESLREQAQDRLIQAQKDLITAHEAILGTQQALLGTQQALVETQRALEQATARLPEHIDTMPSAQFAKSIWSTHEYVLDLFNDKNVSFEEALRFFLEQIASLAFTFDESGASDRAYSANIMFFMPPKRADQLRVDVKFAEEIPMETRLGILAMPPQESLQIIYPEKSSLKRFPPIGLPVQIPTAWSYVEGATTRWRLLPGGPMAFALGTAEALRDIGNLNSWLQQNSGIPPLTRHHVRTWFEDHRDKIGGFLSIPLGTILDVEEGPDPVNGRLAVINIQWTHGNRLTRENPYNIFVGAIQPLCSLLAQAIRRETIESIVTLLFENEPVGLSPKPNHPPVPVPRPMNPQL